MNSSQYEAHLRTVRKGDCGCLACRLYYRDDGFVCHACAARVAADVDRSEPGEVPTLTACRVCWETIDRVFYTEVMR